jgi:hypothetical protein
LQRSPGHGVDCLDLLRAHLEQQLVRTSDDLVLVDARPQHPVDLVVDRVDEPADWSRSAISCAS